MGNVFEPSNCTQGTYHRHTICSYEQAKNRWESVKPIRGRVEDVRPVGNRRATEYRIVKETDPDFEEVDVFKIIYYGGSSSNYNTDYVTYYHDGRVTACTISRKIKMSRGEVYTYRRGIIRCVYS